jgi:hypothetical protein
MRSHFDRISFEALDFVDRLKEREPVTIGAGAHLNNARSSSEELLNRHSTEHSTFRNRKILVPIAIRAAGASFQSLPNPAEAHVRIPDGHRDRPMPASSCTVLRLSNA